MDFFKDMQSSSAIGCMRIMPVATAPGKQQHLFAIGWTPEGCQPIRIVPNRNTKLIQSLI